MRKAHARTFADVRRQDADRELVRLVGLFLFALFGAVAAWATLTVAAAAAAGAS